MLERLDLPETPYAQGLALQAAHHARVVAGAPDVLLLLEHPPTVSLGRHADAGHVTHGAWLEARGVQVVRTDRGGDVTWHGPGQLVGYPIVSLARRGLGVRRYVQALADALREVVGALGVDATWDDAAPGLWTPAGKLAAFGVRVQGGVTTHGFALNVSCDLQDYGAIVPCGLQRPVTSLAALGVTAPPDLRTRVYHAVAASLTAVPVGRACRTGLQHAAPERDRG